jgi:hypothetical protein
MRAPFWHQTAQHVNPQGVGFFADNFLQTATLFAFGRHGAPCDD